MFRQYVSIAILKVPIVIMTERHRIAILLLLGINVCLNGFESGENPIFFLEEVITCVLGTPDVMVTCALEHTEHWNCWLGILSWKKYVIIIIFVFSIYNIMIVCCIFQVKIYKSPISSGHWQTSFLQRLRRTILHVSSELELGLTLSNYKRRFYYLLCFEEKEHITQLTERFVIYM